MRKVSLGGEAVRRALFLLGAVFSISLNAAAQSNWKPLFLLSPPPPALAIAPQPSSSQRIFPVYPWQFNLSFTYFRFYEAPGVTPNLKGFSTSLSYFFWRPLGVEGELTGAYTTQFMQSARFAFVGGGPRFRYVYVGRFEPWGHFDVGHAHYNIQTAFGKKGAFAFQAGGGVDVRLNNWFSIRGEGDAIISLFFNGHQVSPKVAGGMVLNF